MPDRLTPLNRTASRRGLVILGVLVLCGCLLWQANELRWLRQERQREKAELRREREDMALTAESLEWRNKAQRVRLVNDETYITWLEDSLGRYEPVGRPYWREFALRGAETIRGETPAQRLGRETRENGHPGRTP